MTSSLKSVVLSVVFLSCCLYTNAQQDTTTIIKPKQTFIENDYDGVKVKLRVIERSDGVNTVLTQIRNNSNKGVAILFVSQDKKHEIKQTIAPGSTFTGNIGDVSTFSVGTEFFEYKHEEPSISNQIIDWLKIKIRDYFILKDGGLEKGELKKDGSIGVRG